jgi:hypothetical protein
MLDDERWVGGRTGEIGGRPVGVAGRAVGDPIVHNVVTFAEAEFTKLAIREGQVWLGSGIWLR